MLYMLYLNECISLIIFIYIILKTIPEGVYHIVGGGVFNICFITEGGSRDHGFLPLEGVRAIL